MTEKSDRSRELKKRNRRNEIPARKDAKLVCYCRAGVLRTSEPFELPFFASVALLLRSAATDVAGDYLESYTTGMIPRVA